jgi:hypothetical protein
VKNTAQYLGLISLILAGCTHHPAPNPIMPDDLVKDARTAIEIASKACDFGESPFGYRARLVGDYWIVLSSDAFSIRNASVAKRDGKAIDCLSGEI